MTKPLSGLIAAPFTPFTAEGALNLDQIPRLGALLTQNGVRGAFICGTTGEGASLSMEERFRVAEAWAAGRPAGLDLIVHVGHLSLPESQALARHAAGIGADAIATIAPSFFRPANVTDLVSWCREVAAAAPRVPFYYYHMPAMTGVNITVRDFLNEVNGQIPNLAGIKFTHEDLLDFADARAYANGRYNLLFGRDEILLSGLQLGAPGAVGSTYNYAAPLYNQIMRAFTNADVVSARKDQGRAQQFIDIMNRYGGLPAGKTIMKFIGVDCGSVRLPLRPLTFKQEKLFRAELEACGFFEYASRLNA